MYGSGCRSFLLRQQQRSHRIPPRSVLSVVSRTRSSSSSSSRSHSLPPVPTVASLLDSTASAQELQQARDWIEAFERVADTADYFPKDLYTTSYSRSSGPGGQNVNKISSKALLRFNLSPFPAAFVPPYCLPALTASPYHAATPAPNGSILIQSSSHRTAHQNLQESFSKLKETILLAAKVGIKGETSSRTKERIEELAKKEKRKVRTEKEGRKSVKGGRRESGSKAGYD